MAAAAAFTNSTRWRSPVSRDVLAGADISILAGLAVAGGACYGLCRRRAPAGELTVEPAGAEKS